MSNFMAVMGPIIVCWSVPLIPVFYGVIVETFAPSRRPRPVVPSRATTSVQTRPRGARNQAIPAGLEEPSA